jgi:hypothetical protein
MTEELKHRYDLKNLPISEETRKGLTTENINYIGAVGRMLLVQDEFIEGILVDIQKTLVGINKRLDIIEQRLTFAEEKVTAEGKRIETLETRMDKKGEDIKTLRDDYEKNKEHLEYVAKVKPTLESLQNMFKFWTWKNWWKIALIFLAVISLFVALFIGVNFYMHRNGYVTENKDSKHSYNNKMTIEEQMRIINAPTRAATDIKKWTAAQRDSIITEDQKGILMMIEKNNKKQIK